MSAYAARAPRRSTVYVCPVTYRPHPDRPGVYLYWAGLMHEQKISPIATGEISPRRDGTWTVRTTCLPVDRSVIVDSEGTAKQRMSEWLTRVAGAIAMTFSPDQRIAMGQGRCPKLTSGRICDLAPEVGTIWCEWHPGGKERTHV